MGSERMQSCNFDKYIVSVYVCPVFNGCGFLIVLFKVSFQAFTQVIRQATCTT